MSAAVPAPSVPGARRATSRLAGIDGLRAIAALWVVLFHIRAFSGATLHGVPGLDLAVRSGSTGVSLFLVLSGFCLYVPFAGGRSDRFQTWAFLRRRARRLYPAYATTLVITVAVLLVFGTAIALPQPSPGEALGQLAAHLTMVHTFFASTFYAVNGAYWSLGLEWQLYLTLPLLIVGARRFGLTRTVAVAVAVNVVYRVALDALVQHGVFSGVTATAVLPNLFPGRWAEFAFGMVAAELYARHLLGRWTVLAGAVALAAVPVGVALQGGALEHIVFGGIFFGLVVLVLEGSNPVSRVASWRPLAALGTMSYSLYLVHQPIVQSVATVLREHGVSTTATFTLVLLMLPLIVLVGLALFLTVERRTLTAPRQVGTRAESALPEAARPGAVPSADEVAAGARELVEAVAADG